MIKRLFHINPRFQFVSREYGLMDSIPYTWIRIGTIGNLYLIADPNSEEGKSVLSGGSCVHWEQVIETELKDKKII